MSSLAVNDIVQVITESHEWYGCLVVVSEVKSWGMQGYVHSPWGAGDAYIRLKSTDFVKVGTAVVRLEPDPEID